ncbi:MAG: M42 family metallopeptidase [Dehalococcoidia bacterium]|nr:MAG: M42 family metallopeptidase [Dehalococcoidia bacterium]
MDDSEKLLKQLTEASGVAGYEREIREFIKPYFQKFGEIIQDNLGSLICKKIGTAEKPKLVLAAHMDEIGFMAKYISKEGFIKFTALGGWWNQVLLAQRVCIKTHKGDVVGVIGAKPPHVLTEEECKKIVESKDMYIDIGATSKEEVEEAGIRIGDPIIPISEFTMLAGGQTYLAKALDDRVGCALAILTMQRLIKLNHPNTVFAITTAQEEIGARGATTSVELIDPDVAIILEVDIAGDVPGIKPEESPIKLGGGPALLTYDVRMIPNLKLRDLVIDTAKERGIPLQLSVQEGGATDGGPIHLHKSGVPTVVISVPTRHIHSHGAIIHRQDFDHTVDLVTTIVERLDSNIVEKLTL